MNSIVQNLNYLAFATTGVCFAALYVDAGVNLFVLGCQRRDVPDLVPDVSLAR